ncbi:MAG: SxtJ family membrane protein [Mucilaginibacter sp.]
MNENRKFGLSLGSALVALAVYKFLFHHSYYVYLGSAGFFLLVMATFCPAILKPIRSVWEKITGILGTINSYIILFFIFSLIVTPIALLLKLLKKDLLRLNPDKEQNTYWQIVDEANSGSLKQQF